ncbi:MAG: S9 family peptidase, partial [Zymomonas sp.]|nr:S9 family peptidase [Zymomonas sp.]
MRLIPPLVAALPLLAIAAAPAPEISLKYPETPRVDVVEEQFGVKVADPYRWLESDVRTEPKVRAWVDAQNAVTSAYLATLPGRDAFKARMKQLYSYERFGTPVQQGGRYFYTHNSGLQNQSALYVRDSLNGPGRVLIDPNGWAKDGATALAEWRPSPDGKKLLYTIQDGGSDWRTMKVLDVATGQTFPDTIEWVKFTGIGWAKDASGFYYSAFDPPVEGAKFQALNENQKVYFHRLGTPQSADQLVYATPDHPRYGHAASVTDDGRWLMITTTQGTDRRYEITVIDLKAPGAKPRTVIKGLNYEWALAGNVGSKFYFKTNNGAPRLRLVAMDVATDNPVPQQVIAEDKAKLESVNIVGNQIFAEYLTDVKSEVRRYSLKGRRLGMVPLPGIGSAGGFGGEIGDSETFYNFTSFAMPTSVFHYDLKTGCVTPWAIPKVYFNPTDFKVEQVFYPSKDGTRIPMFLVRKKTTTGPAPTLLYAYGGFNISSLPGFSPTRLAWIDAGGVLAVANIRGGGEYGSAWHDGGRLQNKQNVFDDFIAAGEWLKANKITGRDQLAIQGGSNGGLLVG